MYDPWYDQTKIAKNDEKSIKLIKLNSISKPKMMKKTIRNCSHRTYKNIITYEEEEYDKQNF